MAGRAADECLAAHFVVCGLASGQLIRNSAEPPPPQHVITHVVAVARGEPTPAGFRPVRAAGNPTRSAPPSGSVATIGGAPAMQLQLAVKHQPIHACHARAGTALSPVTGFKVIYAERGKLPDEGFEPVCRASGSGEHASFSGGTRQREAFICMSRLLSAETAVPCTDLVVVYADRHADEVCLPPEFELVPCSLTDGAAGPAVYLAVRRAQPLGLLNTPLRPALLDHMAASHRPIGATRQGRRCTTAGSKVDASSRDDGLDATVDVEGARVSQSSAGEGADCRVNSSMSGARVDELPHALPHFCLPHGILLREGGAWPTAHEFALTDATGRRMYGVCLTVWEPLLGEVLLCEDAHMDEPERRSLDDAAIQSKWLSNGDERNCADESATASSAGATPGQKAMATDARETPAGGRPGPHPAQLWDAAREPSKSESHEADCGALPAPRPPGLRLPIDSMEISEISDRIVPIGMCAEDCGPHVSCSERHFGQETAQSYPVPDATPELTQQYLTDAFGAGRNVWWEPAASARHDTGRSRHLPPSFRAVGALRGARGAALAGRSELHAPTCLCVLSSTPFGSGLRKWLCMVYRHSLTASDVPLEALITSLLWEAPMPPQGNIAVRIGIGGEQMTFERPALSRELPDASVPLGPLLNALSPQQVLTLFNATLLEHKILLVSSRLSQLSGAANALLALLWPLSWQGVYIPLLPALLVEVLQSPVPFIVGVHTSTYEAAARALPPHLPHDAFIAHLDDGSLRVPQSFMLPTLPHAHLLLGALETVRFERGTVHRSSSAEISDSASLPAELSSPDAAFPIRQLDQHSEEVKVAKAISTAQRAVVRHTFASFFALLLRGYQDCLIVQNTRKVVSDLSQLIDIPTLLTTRSAVEADWLAELRHTQAFTRFVEQRTSFSSRAPEYVLFDNLADQCATGLSAETVALPALPVAPTRSRVYQVPPPQSASHGKVFGPYDRWPRLQLDLTPTPRPKLPFNFAAAPIQTVVSTTSAARPTSGRSAMSIPRSLSPTKGFGGFPTQAQGPSSYTHGDGEAISRVPSRPPGPTRVDSGLMRLWDSTGPLPRHSRDASPTSESHPRVAKPPPGAMGTPTQRAVHRRSSSMPMSLLRSWVQRGIAIPDERKLAAAEAAAIMATTNDGVPATSASKAPITSASAPGDIHARAPDMSPSKHCHKGRGQSDPATPLRPTTVAAIAAAAAEAARERQLRQLPASSRKWFQLGKGPLAPYVLRSASLSRPPLRPLEWARRTVGELHAAFCIVFSMSIERQLSPSDAVDGAISSLRGFHQLGVLPPQVAHHALLQACIRANLAAHARAVFEQLQETGCKPDALTLGWFQHALLMEGALSPRCRSSDASSQALSSSGQGISRSSYYDSPRSYGFSAPPTPRMQPMRHSSLSNDMPSPSGLEERLAAAGVEIGKTICLRVVADGNGCGCGAELGPREAIEGWHLAGEEADFRYASKCARCSAPWQPLLIIRLGDSPIASASEPATGAMALDLSDEAATTSCPRAFKDGTRETGDLRGGELSCPFLSPEMLLQEIAMITQNANAQYGQRALAEGWRRCRNLFPSLFWNLCWHFAPEGLLRLLPHFQLQHMPAESEPSARRSAPPLYELKLIRCVEENLQACAADGDGLAGIWPPLQAPHVQSTGSLHEDERTNFGGWVDAFGHFRTSAS